MDAIEKIICSCGGQAYETLVSKDEIREYGKYVEAYKCSECDKRWLFIITCPDPDWRD